MTSHMNGAPKGRLITASSQNKGGSSQVRQTNFGQPQGNGGSQRTSSVPFNMRGQGSNGANRRFNNSTPAVAKRKVENLPRTGIEYPIMKLPNQFISQHRELEPLSDKPCP